MLRIKHEPVITFATLHLALNSVQFFVVSMPNWLHGVILALTSITGALAARHQVTPVSSAPVA